MVKFSSVQLHENNVPDTIFCFGLLGVFFCGERGVVVCQVSNVAVTIFKLRREPKRQDHFGREARIRKCKFEIKTYTHTDRQIDRQLHHQARLTCRASRHCNIHKILFHIYFLFSTSSSLLQKSLEVLYFIRTSA